MNNWQFYPLLVALFITSIAVGGALHFILMVTLFLLCQIDAQIHSKELIQKLKNIDKRR